MAQFFEFIGNHWILSSLWIFLLVALITYQKAQGGQSVSPQQATMLVNRSDGVIVDIREKKDFDKGHIVDAINIPLAKFRDNLSQLDKHKQVPVIVVCNLGHQSGEAVKTLKEAGFAQPSRMAGGMTEWNSQGLPVVT